MAIMYISYVMLDMAKYAVNVHNKGSYYKNSEQMLWNCICVIA